MHLYLILFALLIIVVLTAIAGNLLWKLRKQNQKAELAFKEQEQKAAAKVVQTQKDIQFIAKAYLARQVDLSEASLRIHHLANCLGLEGNQRVKVSVFDTVATEIGHIPTHQAWRTLNKEDKTGFRKLFSKLETQYSEQAKLLAKPLAEGELISLS